MSVVKFAVPVACLLLSLNLVCGQSLSAQAAAAPGDNPLQLSIDHTTLSVADIDKEEAWYIQTLGCKEFARSAGPDSASRRLRIADVFGFDLSYHKGSVRTATTGSGKPEQGWLHIVFKTPMLDAVYQKLSAEKVDMKAVKNKDGVVATLLIHDPEGNEIELQPTVNVPR